MQDDPELQMQDDPKLQINEAWSDESGYSPKRTRIVSKRSRILPVVIGVLVVALLAAGILYFITRSSHKEVDPVQAKMAAFEEKIAGLERQITDLQGKPSTTGPDPLLIQRLDALAQKVDALERKLQAQPVSRPRTKPEAQTESKAKTASSRPAIAKKRYHTVQKGETLTRISKAYGISVEKLRKLNNLSTDQPMRAGQRLLVSP